MPTDKPKPTPSTAPATARQKALGADNRAASQASSTVESKVPVSQRAQATEGAPAQMVATAPAYILAIRMDRLIVCDGRVIPFARKLAISEGVNGVVFHRDQRGNIVGIDDSSLKADAIATGWLPIPFEVDGSSYVSQIRSTGGWISRWEKVHPGSAAITTDAKAHADFWRGLMDRGIIEHPPLWALNVLRAELRRMLDQAGKGAKGVSTKQLEQLKGQLAAVDAEIETHVQPDELDAAPAVPMGVP